MKVILQKDVSKLGRKGEIVEVSEGYAKNFLLAKGFGQPATASLQAKAAKEAREAQDKQSRELSKLQSAKAAIEGGFFPVKIKVGPQGQVFGGIHAKEVAAAISARLGIAIDKDQVELDKPIRSLGSTTAKIKLGRGLSAKANLAVEPS